MMRHIFSYLVCAIASLSLIACREEAQVSPKAPIPVRVEIAAKFTPETGQRYSASITPYRQVALSFRSGGYVDWICQVQGTDGRMRNAGPGDQVKQGQPLARVRQKDYNLKVSQAGGQLEEARKSESAARAQLAQAESAAAKAKLDFARADALFATHSITKPDYDAAKAQRDSTQAQVEAARAQIEAVAAQIQSAQAAVGEASLALSDAEIVAPFSGYIVQRQVELGALVAAGSPGFTLADLSSVKAVFGLPDLEVVNLKTGTGLSLTADALSGRAFHGIVTSIAPVADSNTRLFPVEVTVANPERLLLGGMITSLSLGGTRREGVLAISLSAVVRAKEADRYAVVIVQEVGGKARAEVRSVTLGDTLGNKVRIASGLEEGEKVVISGASMLNDGDAVRIIP